MSELRQALMEGRASVPRLGSVEKSAGRFPPFVVVDGGGVEVAPVSGYVKELALSDMSVLTCRSYAYDLLRWFRVLAELKSSTSGMSRPRVCAASTMARASGCSLGVIDRDFER